MEEMEGKAQEHSLNIDQSHQKLWTSSPTGVSNNYRQSASLWAAFCGTFMGTTATVVSNSAHDGIILRDHILSYISTEPLNSGKVSERRGS